jgi:hypothetical protein
MDTTIACKLDHAQKWGFKISSKIENTNGRKLLFMSNEKNAGFKQTLSFRQGKKVGSYNLFFKWTRSERTAPFWLTLLNKK